MHFTETTSVESYSSTSIELFLEKQCSQGGANCLFNKLALMNRLITCHIGQCSFQTRLTLNFALQWTIFNNIICNVTFGIFFKSCRTNGGIQRKPEPRSGNSVIVNRQKYSDYQLCARNTDTFNQSSFFLVQEWPQRNSTAE